MCFIDIFMCFKMQSFCKIKYKINLHITEYRKRTQEEREIVRKKMCKQEKIVRKTNIHTFVQKMDRWTHT